MAKTSGRTRMSTGKAESTALPISANVENIRSIKGLSLVKDTSDDVVINGVLIYGDARIERLRGNISREDYMRNMQRNLISKNPQFKKQIDNIHFKDKGSGVYAIDTKIGGGQIEVEDGYLGERTYHTHVWNATFNMFEDTKWGTLNTAKEYSKNKLKGL